MKTKEVKKKIRSTRKIDGWLSLEAGLLIAALNECQNNNKIDGDIFEIGVHHGKSTVLFANLLTPSQSISVCDIFDSQTNNISQSGSGNKVTFERNVKSHSNIKVKNIYSCLSSELDIKDIGNNFRMFHIDGGHNNSEALPDLILASQAIVDQGIIIVDDPFRSEWPGVTEAIINFLNDHQEFTAVVVGFNKLIICKTEVSDLYLDFLDELENRSRYELAYPFSYKKLPFLNSDLRIFYTLSFVNTNAIKTKLKKKLIHSNFYKWYKKRQ
ncbi:MAG: class I SAM-dependent methyltransferase [Saprospiraceae bacterium]|nr:class I SAM-dependent methyltransferase [Saprospiraceae bacterium]